MTPIIPICSVFVLNEQNKILSVEQFYESLNGNAWTLPGGGIDDGETPEEAARREVSEETGLRVVGPAQRVYHCHVLTPEEVLLDVYGFLYRAHEGDIAITESEISRVDFLSLDEAMEKMSLIEDEARVEPIRHVLELLQTSAELTCYERVYMVDECRRIVSNEALRP